MLDQRRRTRADVVQMLYECFVCAGIGLQEIILYAVQFASSVYTVLQYHTQKPVESIFSDIVFLECFRWLLPLS